MTLRSRQPLSIRRVSRRCDRPDASYQCHSADSYRPAYIAAVVGFPEITVPAGRVSGDIPVGYSFLGMVSDEAPLLALAAAFEASAPRPAGPRWVD